MIGVKNYVLPVCLIMLALAAYASDGDILTASEQGDLEAVMALVTENPQLVASVDTRGYTPLHKAAYNNHLNIAEYLISRGADINAVSEGGSAPLHGAASYGHLDVVRLLVDRGAAIDVANAGGYTPLLGASMGNHGEIVRFLVNRGANVNASVNNGSTPLAQAVWNDDLELTKFLLDKGAETNIRTESGLSLSFFTVAFRDRELALMLAGGEYDPAETDAQGLGMLHYSAARGATDLVQALLSKGAEVNLVDSLGRTPLDYALLWGNDDIAGILRQHGARVGETLDQAWFRGDYLGRPRPGKIPVELVGDELRTPFGPHGRLAFSPDGREMIWCHQAMPIQAMWYTRQIDGAWVRPTIAPFTDPALDFADGNPCFSADGRRVYYHTQRVSADGAERREDCDIWFVEKAGDSWGDPVSVGPPVNTDKNELGPMIAPSGNLYFTGSDYDDSYGTSDIYLAEFKGGGYTVPQNLGPAINSEYNELTPIVPPDESYILFVSNRPTLRGRMLQLYVSFKADEGWTEAVSLGSSVNQGHTWQPSITADGKSVVCLRGSSYYWFSTALIEDMRVAMIGEDPPETGISIPGWRKSEQVFEHAATNDIALGDLDGDSDLDAVFSNMHRYGSRVYLNDGRGQFTASEQILTEDGHGVELGDLDADGDLDAVISCNGCGPDLMVYFNDGRANFTVSSQNMGDSALDGTGVALYDIDTDGDLDAAISFNQHDNIIYLNDGRGQFARSDQTFPRGATWADLDGDGDVDMLQREPEVGFKTLLNDGTGQFVEYWSKADSATQRGWVGLCDFDGDGDIDAAIPYQDDSEHRFSTLWYNDGTGRFMESEVRLPLTRLARMSIGDLNGDGHPDIFLNNFGMPSSVWLNDGDGGLFDSGVRLPGEWLNTYCPLGDLDGDGDLDVFLAAFVGGPNEVWFNE